MARRRVRATAKEADIAQLRRERDEALEQQAATSEVLRVISRSPGDLRPVFDIIATSALRLCGSTWSGVLQFNGELIELVALHNLGDFKGAEAVRRSFPRKPSRTGATDRAISTGTATYIRDVLEVADYDHPDLVRAAVYRSVLSAPMLRNGHVVGAITVVGADANAFTDRHIDLLKTFADQAAIAIENVRLFEAEQQRSRELTESLQQQTATSDVLKVISRSTFDLQIVLDTLVESAARLCDADSAAIHRPKGDVYPFVASCGYSPEYERYMRDHPINPRRGSVLAQTLHEGKAFQIGDVLADPDYSFIEQRRIGGYRTVLGIPLLREGSPIGVLILTRSKVNPFSDKQIELATTFADQAVIAIENVRLFDEVQSRTRELAKSLDDLRTTQDRLVQTQKLASLGQLTAGIAHEIKNPLNFVNNFSGISAELIDELQDTLKGPLDEKARAEIKELTDTLRGNLDKVVQHGRRADAIVRNMLQHSREGSGEHRVVDINALVEESLNLAWHGARAEKQGFDVTLERSFDPSAGEADIFPQDITRALLNLIVNGFYAATKRKADTDGGDYAPTLFTTTKSLGDRVEIRIRDNGTGISPEVKDKMFNPFFTTKPTGEGTGLGLSISHDIIVKQHGGSIEVDTQPGEFTEIRVILPRTAALLPDRS